MKLCELSEFTFLLKLGLWSGGTVAGLGYVTAAGRHTGEVPTAGLGGVWLGGGVTLESADDGRLVLSAYDPYGGRYDCFTVSADFNVAGHAGRPSTLCEVELALAATIEQEEKNNRRGRGATFSEHKSLRDKRRYDGSFSSYRTGQIAKPNRRR